MHKFFVLDSTIVPRIENAEQLGRYVDFRPPFEKHIVDYITTKQDCIRDIDECSAEYQRLPRHAFSIDDLRSGYREFDALRQSQYSWSTEQECAFVEAFALLPQLSSVRIDRQKHIGEPRWRSLKLKTMVEPNDWSQDGYELDFDVDHAVQSSPTTTLIKALNKRSELAVSQIHTIDLENNYGHAFVRKPFPELVDLSEWGVLPADQDSQFGAFRSILSLHLNISYLLDDTLEFASSDEMAWHSHCLIKDLRKMLSNVEALQELNLEFKAEIPGREYVDYDGDFLESNNILSLLGELRFPSLTKLDLSCSTTEEDLYLLLSANSTSLRSLELNKCYLLEEGDWNNVIRNLPKLVHLDKICLYKLGADSQPWAEESLFMHGVGLDDGEPIDPLDDPNDPALAHSLAMSAWILRGEEFHGDMPPLDLMNFERLLYGMPEEEEEDDDDAFDVIEEEGSDFDSDTSGLPTEFE